MVWYGSVWYGIWGRSSAALLHAIFSRVVCLLFSLLFNVRSASQQLVAVAGAFTAKILNKLLPHLQLRKEYIYKINAPATWNHINVLDHPNSQLLCGKHNERHCATPYNAIKIKHFPLVKRKPWAGKSNRTESYHIIILTIAMTIRAEKKGRVLSLNRFSSFRLSATLGGMGKIIWKKVSS